MATKRRMRAMSLGSVSFCLAYNKTMALKAKILDRGSMKSFDREAAGSDRTDVKRKMERRPI